MARADLTDLKALESGAFCPSHPSVDVGPTEESWSADDECDSGRLSDRDTGDAGALGFDPIRKNPPRSTPAPARVFVAPHSFI